MSEIHKQLETLEKVSRQLEPNEEERAQLNSTVLTYANSFLNGIHSFNAFINVDEEQTRFDSDFNNERIDINTAIKKIESGLDQAGLNPASGGHLGYIPGGGIYTAALGDYLADISNNYAGVDFAGPGAVNLENSLIKWMASLIGYPENSGGNLASGGSIANLVAVTTAREAHDIKAIDIQKTVIYLSTQAHHCVDKAIRIAGLKECILRYVAIDEKCKIIPHLLDQQIQEDKANGLKPFMVVASAGTTDVGAIDPLEDIGGICKRYKLWYHIDAAYGGFFILTTEGKQKLKGIELSDSVVLDPHKDLFLPYGLGTVLIKNKKKMHEAHHYNAAYLQDAVTIGEVQSPAELSPELTKHFRGLRLWLPLKIHGLTPFKACLEEKLLLAKYFVEEIQKLEGFEVYLNPELSVATYRYIPKQGNPNKFNEALVKATHEDGRVFITSTTVNGTFLLRLAILSFRTHKNTIDLAIEVLKDGVAKVLRENTFAEVTN